MNRKTIPHASLALLLLLATACSKPAEPTSKVVRTQSATVAKVGQRQIARTLTLAGQLVAREEAAVGTELNGYRVAKVFVEAGAVVQAAEPLARLDDTLILNQIAQQEALVAQQQVSADKAAEEAKRVEGLDDAGALSKEIVNERKLQARSAAAALAQAQAQLKDLTTRHDLMVIRAPVSGTVLTRSVRPGDIASPGTAMFTMVRDRLVELDADVPERDLALISAGTPAIVRLPSGAHFSGSVRLISPQVDEKTRLGRVRINLPVDAGLKPGGFGEATIEVANKDAVVVPVTSVQYNADGSTVMIMDAGHIARRRSVRTGAVSDKVVEIVSGVQPGETVVVTGAALLLPGDKINPVTARTEEN